MTLHDGGQLKNVWVYSLVVKKGMDRFLCFGGLRYRGSRVLSD